MQEAKKEIMRLYGGKGWPSFFTRIRLFITAPFDALDKHIPQEGFIVDLGCGYGIFANLLGLLSAKRKILGMDLDGFKMRHADKGIPNVEFRLADITKTNIPPADCILLIHVLHHLASSEDQEPLVRACLDRIKSGDFDLGAEVSAVALKAGAAKSTEFERGMAIFVQPKGGLMAEASVKGQKISFEPMDQGEAASSRTPPARPGSNDSRSSSSDTSTIRTSTSGTTSSGSSTSGSSGGVDVKVESK